MPVSRRRRPRFSAGTIVWQVVIWTILAFLLVPSLIVIITAFNDQKAIDFPPQSLSLRWFRVAFAYDDFRLGFANGVIITAWASVIAVIVGTTAAYAIDRFDFSAKAALETLLLSPLVIPHFTVGLSFLILASNIWLTQSYALVIVTHVVLVLPFVLRNVYVSLRNLDPSIARAAEGLGASRLQVFLRVDLPLLLPGVFGGWLFAGIISFNEVTATLFVTVQRNQTLPVAMYAYVRDAADPSLAAVSTLLIISTAALLIFADRYLGLRRLLGIEGPP